LPPKPFQPASPPVIGIPAVGPDASAVHSAVAMAHSAATRPVEAAPTTRPAETAMHLPPTTSPITDAATTRPVLVAMTVPRPAGAPVGQSPTTTQPSPVKRPATPPIVALASAA